MPTGNVAIKSIWTRNPREKFLSPAKPLMPTLIEEKVPWRAWPEVIPVHQSLEGQTRPRLGCHPPRAPKRAWAASLLRTKAGSNHVVTRTHFLCLATINIIY